MANFLVAIGRTGDIHCNEKTVAMGQKATIETHINFGAWAAP